MNINHNFQLRAPTEADIPAIVNLCNLCWRRLSGNDYYADETALRSDWAEPGFDPARDCRVAIAADNTPVAIGRVNTRSPFVTFYSAVQVHPDYENLGIGSALTAWTEEYASARLHEAPSDAQVVLNSGVLTTDTVAARLLQDHGYRLIRSFYEMKIDMQAPPPAPQLPEGITIRPLIAEQDKVAAYLAHQDAFKDHYGFVQAPFDEDFPRWWHHIHEHPSYDPSTLFLAVENGKEGEEIAGYIFCYAEDYEMPDLAWIENVGVRRQWRRRGLALALLNHAFGEMYQRGRMQVALAVDADSLTGATRLYEKAGMRTFRQFDRYSKELRSGKALSTQTVTE